jgi:IS5 family transposase
LFTAPQEQRARPRDDVTVLDQLRVDKPKAAAFSGDGGLHPDRRHGRRAQKVNRQASRL